MKVPVHGADAFIEVCGHDTSMSWYRYTHVTQDWLTNLDSCSYLHTCIHGRGGWLESTFSSRPVKR